MCPITAIVSQPCVVPLLCWSYCFPLFLLSKCHLYLTGRCLDICLTFQSSDDIIPFQNKYSLPNFNICDGQTTIKPDTKYKNTKIHELFHFRPMRKTIKQNFRISMVHLKFRDIGPAGAESPSAAHQLCTVFLCTGHFGCGVSCHALSLFVNEPLQLERAGHLCPVVQLESSELQVEMGMK